MTNETTKYFNRKAQSLIDAKPEQIQMACELAAINTASNATEGFRYGASGIDVARQAYDAHKAMAKRILDTDGNLTEEDYNNPDFKSLDVNGGETPSVTATLNNLRGFASAAGAPKPVTNTQVGVYKDFAIHTVTDAYNAGVLSKFQDKGLVSDGTIAVVATDAAITYEESKESSVNLSGADAEFLEQGWNHRYLDDQYLPFLAEHGDKKDEYAAILNAKKSQRA